MKAERPEPVAARTDDAVVAAPARSEAGAREREIARQQAILQTTLEEALEQQLATADILRAISRSPSDSQPVFEAIVRTGLRLFAGAAVSIALPDGDQVRAVAIAESDPARAEAWRQRFPFPLTRDYMHGVAILDAIVVDIPDVRDAPPNFASGARNFLASGYLGMTIVPLLRGDTAIGALSVVRREAGPLSAKQHAALRTFAEQAVIAIENARRFNEIRESLEQQTASAEVLRVISSSIGDTAPVFEKMMESCERLFAGRIVGLNLVDSDGMIQMGVYHGPGRDGLERIFPLPLEPTSGSSLAILERRVVHYPDVDHGEGVPVATRTGCRAIGVKSVIFAPLLWEGRGIGAIFVGREFLRSFSDREIALLQTFADQAAIAIENARLFRELEQRNREAAEALEQQTATAGILRVISRSPTDVQPVFDAIASSARALCNARTANVVTFDGTQLHLAARVIDRPDGPDTASEVFPRPVGNDTAAGRAIMSRRIAMIPDVLDDQQYAGRHVAQALHSRSFLGVPLLRDGNPIGAIVIGRPQVGPFPDKQIALLQTFADQAVIAIENARLFRELEERNREAAEALEQQTATAEILRVISQSPTDVQPVFDAIAERAMTLCGARIGGVARYDGELVHLVSFRAPQAAEGILERFPMKPSRAAITTRAILEAKPVQVTDILEDPDYALTRESLNAGFRANLAVPMLKDGHVIGAIGICREDPGPFPDKQIQLLQTFADQAVIAIENVRLFNETKDALERQTATTEILRVISSSPTSTTPVFEAILASSARLCEADMGLVLRYEDDMFQTIATLMPDPAFDAYLRQPINAGPLTGLGRIAMTKQPVHIPDLIDDVAYRAGDPLRMRSVELGGVRTWLGVPMLRDGELIGAIAIYRKEVRPFEPRQIEVLCTFADQAVIAIENVRLFNETKDALDQQRASADVLTAISNSIADTKPVFDVILQSCQRLFASETVGMTLVRDDGMLDIGAYAGPGEAELRSVFPRPLDRTTSSGRAILDQRVQIYADVESGDMPPTSLDGARAIGLGAMVFAPMLFGGQGIGTLWIGRRGKGPFSAKQIALLATFADQAVIAIQNARLFNATQEALETQTATAEVLRVISQSPTDVQPVFEAIAERAKVLCGAVISGVGRFDGEWVHLVAYGGVTPEAEAAMRKAFPMRPGRRSILARAVAESGPVQIADVLADPEYDAKEPARISGFRSNLAVPMLKDGEVIGAIGVCRAETGTFPEHLVRLLQTFADQAVIAIENVRLFNELRDKSEQLELASQHKSEFLANMSHELRTPLNAIIGFTRIVMRRSKDALEVKQYENLEKILASGQHLLALINSILDLAKVEAGRVELHPEEIALEPLLADCARTVEPLLDESAIKLVRSIDSTIPPLFVDQEKLRQIVINLLSNAAKFTPKGTIRIAAARAGDEVTIAVHDTGIGIPADKLETVFEEFEQAGRTGSDVQRGTGLGLTIARRLARLMGGDITAASTLGSGSTFTVNLPLRYAQAAPPA